MSASGSDASEGVYIPPQTMNHPPLCPKTPDVFTSLKGGHVGCIGSCSDYPETRRFLARYQACAWHDRSARYRRVFKRRQWRHADGTGVSTSIILRAVDCDRNSALWREWEKNPAGWQDTWQNRSKP
jgi:hypothetical protein